MVFPMRVLTKICMLGTLTTQDLRVEGGTRSYIFETVITGFAEMVVV